LLFQSIAAQKIELKIKTTDTITSTDFNLVDYIHFHTSESALYSEIDSTSLKLSKIGYLNNRVDSIKKQDTIYTAYFNLAENNKTIRIYYPKNSITSSTLKKLSSDFTDSYFKIEMSRVENSMNTILQQFEIEGKSFTEVNLINIRKKNKEITAQLVIKSTKTRTIDKVIVKGYAKFPKSFIKHNLNLKTNTVFNLNKLKHASNAIETLPFTSETKAPEVLFTNDSTNIYLYLQKNKSNRFDGLIGFSTNEEGKLSFNGYLDLLLNNILNKGEVISIQWKSNGDERKLFDLAFTAPYIFNSPITPSLNFNLYKQDSTFLNIHTTINLAYTLNQFNTVAANYESENSTNLISENTHNNIESFKSTFFGGSYIFRKPDNQKAHQDKISLQINALLGNRELTETKVKIKQQKYNLKVHYIWNLSKTSSVFIQNKSGLLISDDLISNELYRIGGANSIRGFDEESIFASSYSIFNLEYRYYIASLSYLYSITDFAYVQNDIINENTQLFGFGLGYVFTTKNGNIDVSYALGKQSNLPIDFQNSRFHIRLVQYF